MTHEIELTGYYATNDSIVQNICFGTAGSYGMEMLRLSYDSAWQGLGVRAVFWPCGVEVAVIDGVVDVPAEATAEAGNGEIVFSGYKDGVKIKSATLPFTVIETAADNGMEAVKPTPAIVDQIMQAAQEAKTEAHAATETARSAEAAITETIEKANGALDAAETAQYIASNALETAKDTLSAAKENAAQAAKSAESAGNDKQAAEQAASNAQESATSAAGSAAAADASAQQASTAEQQATAAAETALNRLNSVEEKLNREFFVSTIRPTVSGAQIHIDDAAEYPLQELTIYGECEQGTKLIISVGGENVLKNVDFRTSAYNTRLFETTGWGATIVENAMNVMKRGMKYVLSYEFEIIGLPDGYEKQNNLIGFVFTSSAAKKSYVYARTEEEAIVGNKGFRSYTFELPQDVPDDLQIYLFTGLYSNSEGVKKSATVKFSKLKIEAGESATAWTQAVEDGSADGVQQVESIPFKLRKLNAYSDTLTRHADGSGTHTQIVAESGTELLETPIVTEYTAEQMKAILPQLSSYYGTTNIYTDAGAGIAVQYVADPALYINKKLAEIAGN